MAWCEGDVCVKAFRLYIGYICGDLCPLSCFDFIFDFLGVWFTLWIRH